MSTTLDPRQEDVSLRIEGMHCAGCVTRIEEALRRVPGVREATVNLATREARVRFEPAAAGIAEFERAIEEIGYGASPIDTEDVLQAAELEEKKTTASYRVQVRTLAIAGVLALPVVVISMADLMFPGRNWLLFALTVPVVFWAGWPFHVAAFKALRHGTADMNTLISLGTMTAFVASVVVTVAPWDVMGSRLKSHVTVHTAGTNETDRLKSRSDEGMPPVYYEAAAMITVFVLLGRLLEERARGKASQAIQRLIGLQPRTATILRDGTEREIPIQEVVPGDIILVRPGDRIPVDGTVVEGRSAINESMLTGESLPVSRGPGDPVIGGTINTTGSLRFRAEKVGRDTVLAHIVRLVREAQGSKAPIARLADRVSAYFVPTVLAIAAVTGIAWLVLGPHDERMQLAITCSVSVLIIACPCALGLATPTAIMVGTGKGAEQGVLIKTGTALEAACRLNTIVFDKTGTITRGQAEVGEIILPPSAMNDRSRNEGGLGVRDLLQLAASAEYGSEHALGEAIVRSARSQGVELQRAAEFAAVEGEGIRATVTAVSISVPASGQTEGPVLYRLSATPMRPVRSVLIGNERFLRREGVELEELAPTADRLAGEGKTPVFVAVDGRLAGLIVIADSLKEDSAATVARLKERGVEVVMLTGDNRRTAEFVAKQVGIDVVWAEVRPAEKSQRISERQAAGRVVGMVGDGINDAPALAQADIGFAIGSGTDVAMEAGDITLVGSELAGVERAIELSQQTMRTIRQNLFFAFIYNLLGIPIAAGVVYPFTGLLLNPMIASAAMAASSVSVVVNSLRLRR